MPPEVHEPLEEVLKHYPLTVLDIRNESYKEKKGVWWVRTTSGMKILKKISNSEQTLRFILDAVRHLRNNGVLLPEVNRTSDGSEYVNIEGTCFVLTDAVEGKKPSYSSPEEGVDRSTLADFHRASGFKPLKQAEYHQDMAEVYSEGLRICVPIMTLLMKSTLDAIESVIANEFPYYYERGKQIEGLKGNDYMNWSQKAESKAPCADFAAGNLLLTDGKSCA